MRFYLGEQEDNLCLQIAWNVGTVGINPNRIKKGMMKRAMIKLYDVSKSCQLIYEKGQEIMTLKAQAYLLCGVSRIMSQQTSFLYEDSIHLRDRLQTSLSVSPARNDHIDLKRPIANRKAITLSNQEDLIEYETNQIPFDNLFDFSHFAGGPEAFDARMDRSEMDSLLIFENKPSVDLPNMEFDYPKIFFHQQELELHALTDSNNNPITMDINNDMVSFDFDDMDIDYGVDVDYGDLDPQDFMRDVTSDTDHSNSVRKEDIFEFPNPMQENTNSSISGGRSSPSAISPSTPSSTTFGHVYSRPPPPLMEEDEYDTSLSSINTDILNYGIVNDDTIQVSPVPPEIPRPHSVRRMVLQRQEDTVMPWSAYTTDNILRKSTSETPHTSNAKKLGLLQMSLKCPSMALNNVKNDLTEDQLTAIMRDEKYRLFYTPMRLANTEYGKDQIEIARRYDQQRRNSSSNSSHGGGGIHVRSSSDVTGSVEMQQMDLGDIDMQNAEIRRNGDFSFDGNYAYDDDNYDDNIDYGHFDFDDPLQSLPSMEVDDEHQCNLFYRELEGKMDQDKVYFSHLIQSQNRAEIAKSYYFILGYFCVHQPELASKRQIRLHQMEPFGEIEIKLLQNHTHV